MLITNDGRSFPGYRRGPKGLYYKESTYETRQRAMSVRDVNGNLIGHLNFAYSNNQTLESIVAKQTTSSAKL